MIDLWEGTIKTIETLGFPAFITIVLLYLFHKQMPKITEAINKNHQDTIEAHKEIAHQNRESNKQIADEYRTSLEAMVKANRETMEKVSHDTTTLIMEASTAHQKVMERRDKQCQHLTQALIDLASNTSGPKNGDPDGIT